MAKQNKPTNKSAAKPSATKPTKLSDSPKPKSKFIDDEEDDDFDLPMDEIDGFDDLKYDDDDDY